MPVPTRQATPGPSTISGATTVSIPAPSANSKKRAGSEVGDDARDVKKVKVDGEALPLLVHNREKDKDKKKKKKKKKRRTSVVPGAAQTAVREREGRSVPPPSLVAPKRKSPELTNGQPRDEKEEERASSSSDKGKGKAHLPQPPRVPTPPAESEQPVASGSGSSESMNDQASEITRLKAQLASQKSLLDRHQTHLNQHQQSLTCQICLDLMHKPYALSPCGHMTCYGCLVRWFTAPANPDAAANQPAAADDSIDGILNSAMAVNGMYIRRRKNCPVCRAAVTERPIEMWAIKSMVGALVKSGLGDLPLPAPTAVDNAANPDPWRNVFRKAGGNARHFIHGFYAPPPPPPAPAGDEDRAQMGWYDGEDGGIYRCIDCYHEIVYGRCSHCARAYPGHAGHDEDDDEDDDDPDMGPGFRRFLDDLVAHEDDMDDESVDDEAYFGEGGLLWGDPRDDDDQDDEDGLGDDEPPFYGPLHRRMDHLFESDVDIDEDPDDEDYDDYDLGHYLPHPHQVMAHMLFGQQPPPLRRRAARIEEILDDEEEDSDYEGSFIDDGGEDDAASDGGSHISVNDDEVEVLDGPRPPRMRRTYAAPGPSTDEEVEEIEAVNFGRRRGRPNMRHSSSRRPVVIDDDDDEADEQHTDRGSDLETGSLSSHGHRLPFAFTDEEEDNDEEDDDEEY